VAVPVDLSADPTFAELLRRTHRTVRAVGANQFVTFEQVAAEFATVRDSSRHPVFQASFTWEGPIERWDLSGVHASSVELESALTATVDLALVASDDPAIELAARYARDLYEPTSIERLLDALEHVLAQVHIDPSVAVRDLSVVPEHERELVVRRWNQTTAPYPKDKCLHELFEEQVARDPGAAAVIDAAGTVVSYRELATRANLLAHRLRALGVGPESFVGICVDHSVEMLVGLFGIMKAGGAYVPLDPELPQDRLAYMLSDTGAGAVVTVAQLRETVPTSFAGTVLCLDTDWAEISAGPDTPVRSGVTAQNLVYAMYTSGSTGRPKGVLISHQGLNNYLWWAIEGYGLAAGSGAPMVGSIAYDLSVPNFYLPLIGGKAVRLLPVADRLVALSELLAEPRDFSLLKVTPGHLDVLRGLLANRRVTSVGTFVVGADEVRPETVAGWQRIAPNARIINEYGPTETVVGCSVYPVGERFDASAPVPIGLPIANIRMYVLDELLDPVPIGVTGELYIGGDGVARGYLGRPDLTAERFLPDPYAPEPGARIYRSGDLARRRPDGDIDFLGRIDHQVKINGYRIELGEVEARLLAHHRVSEAVVVAHRTRGGQKQLVAYVVLGPGDEVATGTDEFAAWLAQTLPGYMVPARFVLLDRMPLTQAGKVDRTALPELDR
jgi:amino acid adenylation domain-containing protein